MKKCVYCDKILDTESSSNEHIIHQGLGGHLQSDIICCSGCNSKLGSGIDADFVKIFNPIISRFNMTKSRGNEFNGEYKGIVQDKSGIKYNAKFKGNKLMTIFDLHNNSYIKHIDKKSLENYNIVSLSIDINEDNILYGIKKLLLTIQLCVVLNPKI